MIQDYEQYITEARTNPTSMSRQVKTWAMEIMNEIMPKARIEDLDTMIRYIVIGLQQGKHEYEKVFPDETDLPLPYE
jgi:hypothetical protein